MPRHLLPLHEHAQCCFGCKAQYVGTWAALSVIFKFINLLIPYRFQFYMKIWFLFYSQTWLGFCITHDPKPWNTGISAVVGAWESNIFLMFCVRFVESIQKTPTSTFAFPSRQCCGIGCYSAGAKMAVTKLSRWQPDFLCVVVLSVVNIMQQQRSVCTRVCTSACICVCAAAVSNGLLCVLRPLLAAVQHEKDILTEAAQRRKPV